MDQLRKHASTARVGLVSAAQEDPRAQRLLADPLPAAGPVYPIAFARELS
jgi:hypothetical protein